MSSKSPDPSDLSNSPRTKSSPNILASASIKARDADDKYAMGSYGTFQMDTIHGRLFELNVFVESIKMHMYMYFAFVLITLVFGWGALFLSPIVSLVAGKDKDMQMFAIILGLGGTIAFTIWLIPTIIVAEGGFWHFMNLIFVKKELNFLDFVDFILCELMLLLTIVLSWVFHEIAIDVEKYKESTKESWRNRHGEFGLDVFFDKPQLKRLTQVLREEEQRELEKTFSSLGDQPGLKKTLSMEEEDPHTSKMLLQDVVTILECLPGWDSNSGEGALFMNFASSIEDHMQNETGNETGLFSSLSSLSEEANEKHLWPIDIWLVRTQYYPDDVITVPVGMKVATKMTWDMMKLVWNKLATHPIALVVITILALVRSLLPRFWLSYALGGKFWPDDAYGPAGRLVMYSTLATFTVSWMFIGLFYFVLMEYRRNVVQVCIVSSLVDARMRVVFSQFFLMSSMWFGFSPEESEAVLAKMPLIDLRISSNVAAFWRIREYCSLDRSNERMAISVLLEMVIIWLGLKFLATIIIMAVYSGNLPAVLVVTLFDLIVFGVMILEALNSALKMNQMMDQHKQIFVEAKYAVTMSLGQISKDNKYNEDYQKDRKRRDLEISRRLLTEYLDMSNEYDTRDRILFGMTVTPGKILSSAATIAAMSFSLIAKALKSGQVKVPKGLDEPVAAFHAVGAEVGVKAMAHGSRFLWNHLKPN